MPAHPNAQSARGEGADGVARGVRLFARGSILSDLEAMLGMILTSFVALSVSVGGFVFILMMFTYNQPPLPTPRKLEWTAVWMLATVGVVKSVRVFVRLLEWHHPPKAINAALRQHFSGLLHRILITAWWFIFGLAILVVAEALVYHYKTIGVTTGTLATRYTLEAIVYFGAAYAANVYFLLAVAAIYPHRKMIAVLWHGRVLFDIAAAFALTSFGVPGWIH